MKAIIIAAGRGSRLGDLTQQLPKCLLEVGGVSLLNHQLNAFKANGIDNISLIKGYQREKIDLSGIKYYINENFEKNNILLSLMCAEKEMDDAFIATYSDIYFEDAVVSQLLAVREDISIVVDLDWKACYAGRDSHPIQEAENILFDKNGNVVRIGKSVGNEGAVCGEFIGMLKCSKKGAQIWREYFHKAKNDFQGRPFGEAKIFDKSYVTDFIQYLVDKGIPVKCLFIRRGWFEIDTPEDLGCVNQFLKEKQNGRINFS